MRGSLYPLSFSALAYSGVQVLKSFSDADNLLSLFEIMLGIFFMIFGGWFDSTFM